MRIPESTIEEISRRIDMVELVSNYVTLKPSGSRYMGLCPFHSEKTPSFSVNPEVGAFYCFGCHKGGSAFNFVMEMEGLTFPEAVRYLGERVGVEVSTEQDDDSSRRRKALLELYSRVARSFHYVLTESEQGREARGMLDQRGISTDARSEFLIGFAPTDPFWLHGFLEKKEYSPEFLARSGLFTRSNPKRALFSGRIMFPIRDRRGDVIGFGGRLLQGEGPKYINTPETEIFHKSSSLYGIHVAHREIRSKRRVVLAEGYTDVIALHSAGVTNAVAALGTALTEQHAKMLARSCDVALLVFDGDSAGVTATRRAVSVLEKHGIRCEVALLDQGTDPADLLRNGGSQGVMDALSSPIAALEFLVQTAQAEAREQEGGTGSPEAKAFVLERVFPYISVMHSEVKRRESLRMAADLVGVDREAVLRDYGRYHRGAAKRSPQSESRSFSNSGRAEEDIGREWKPSARHENDSTSHELFLMLAAIASREHFAYIRRWIQPEDLENRAAREIYVALEEAFRRDESSLELLLERIGDDSVTEHVRRRLTSGEFDGSQEQAIRDGVASVRRRVLEKKIHEVELKLRSVAVGTRNGSDEVELLGEKMYLDKELQKLKGEGA